MTRVFLLIMSFTVLVACQSDMPGVRPATPAPSGPSEPGAVGTTERFAQDRTPESIVPRGRWEMRLWIGIWCDRDGRRGDPSFRVEVDGIEMMETRSTCRSYRSPPDSEPNAGFLGFTLGEGVHLLTVIPPVGEPYSERIAIDDDTWAIVHYTEVDGVPQIDVSTQNEALRVDRDYDPDTRPLPPEERDRVAIANAERAATGRPTHPPPGAFEDPSGGDGVGAEQAPAGEGGSSGSSRGDRRRDEAGWVEGTPGYLAVESARPVRVWVDGQSLGAAPIRRHTLGAGEHRVVLRGDGGFERSFQIEVEPHRTYELVNDQ